MALQVFSDLRRVGVRVKGFMYTTFEADVIEVVRGVCECRASRRTGKSDEDPGNDGFSNYQGIWIG